MKLITILSCLFLFQASLCAQESVDEEKRKTAEQRAEALMKDLAAKQAKLDDQARADIQQLDLITRKAEAYILVEQPVDAGRMLAEAQALLKQYQADPREDLKNALKPYKARLFKIGQIVLEHTASIDLDEGDKATATDTSKSVQSEPAPVESTQDSSPKPAEQRDLNQKQE